MDKMGKNNPGAANGNEADDEHDEEGNGQEGNIKFGSMLGRVGAKPVNGGLEIYNKMDIKFQI